MKSLIKIHEQLFFLMVVCALLTSSCTSRKEAIQWGEITYKIFEGEWQSLPDFKNLDPTAEGISEQIAIDWVEEKENFAMVFAGTFSLRENDILEVRLHTDRHSRLLIDGEPVLEKKHRDYNFRTSVSLEKGCHEIRIEYLHTTGMDKEK